MSSGHPRQLPPPVRVLTALLGLWFFASLATSGQDAVFTAKVVGIVDGDTLAVFDGETQYRLRLECIDAPEPGQQFSSVSREMLAALAMGEQVSVRIVDRDRYSRYLARVDVGGRDLSAAMVASGLAWHYKQYCDDTQLAGAENDARERRVGMWAVVGVRPPWEYRAAQAEERARQSQGRAAGSLDSTRDTAAPSSGVVYHGNRSSKVFHKPSCRYYHCANCTAVFHSREEAIAAGYRPGGHCRP